MARPRKVGLDYFQHDSSASHDTKIMAMELEHGLAGYAFYFKLLELLYAEGELNLSNKATYGACVKTMGIGRDAFDAMLVTALECGLFDQDVYEQTGSLTSRSIERRANFVNSRRASDAETQQKPNNNHGNDDNNSTETQQKPCNNDPICSVSAEFPSRDRIEQNSTGKSTEQNTTAQDRGNEKPARAKGKPSALDDIRALGDEYTEGDPELRAALDGFLTMRKGKRDPINTVHAMKLLLGKLDELGRSPKERVELLNQSTLRGWKGIFPMETPTRSLGPPGHSQPRSDNVFADMARERGLIP